MTVSVSSLYKCHNINVNIYHRYVLPIAVVITIGFSTVSVFNACFGSYIKDLFILFIFGCEKHLVFTCLRT